MKTTVTFQLDTDQLTQYTDQYLAHLWHIAMANPAPMEDRAAGRLAEHVGREIIRRWLASQPADLWSRQGRHADWWALQQLKQAQAGEVPA